MAPNTPQTSWAMEMGPLDAIHVVFTVTRTCIHTKYVKIAPEHTCGCTSAKDRHPGGSLACQSSPACLGSTAQPGSCCRKPPLGRTGLPKRSVVRCPEAAPRAARAWRPHSRPARCGRRLARRAHVPGTGRCGIDIAGGSHAYTATWGGCNGSAGRGSGHGGSAQQRHCGGVATA